MTRAFIALAGAALFLAGPAAATTITFDGIPGTLYDAPTYTESGYTFTSLEGSFFGFPSAGQLHFDPGGLGNTSYDLTYSGGGFTLSQVDISFSSPGATAVLEAYDLNDVLLGSLSFDVSTEGTLSSPFPNLVFGRLRVTNTVDHFSIDNLVVNAANAVPEPATWAMMIGGMGAAGGALRRRRDVAVRFA